MAKKNVSPKEPDLQSQPEVKNELSVNRNILFLQNKENKALSAIRQNQEGKPEMEPLKSDMLKSLQRFDSNSNFFSAFLDQLVSQIKNPDHFAIYSVPEKLIKKVLKPLGSEVKLNLTPEMEDKYLIRPQNEMNHQQVHPQPEAPAQEVPAGEHPQVAPQVKAEETNPPENTITANPETLKTETRRFPIDENKIDWNALNKKWGITKEYLKELGVLEDLLYGRRTGKAVRIHAEATSGERIDTDAKIEIRYGKHDELNIYMHGIKASTNLNREFFGHTFSEEDKRNLLSKDGNMGRMVNLKFPNQTESVPCLISRDKITNDLLFMPVAWIKIPDNLKGVKLSEEQKVMLKEGQAIESQNFVSKDKKTFAARVQYDVERKSLRFIYPDRLKIGNTICGVKLNDKQKEELKAGKEIYLENMVRKSNGHTFSSFVRADFKQNKFDFSDKSFLSAVEISSKPSEKPQQNDRSDKNQKPENKKNKGVTVH